MSASVTEHAVGRGTRWRCLDKRGDRRLRNRLCTVIRGGRGLITYRYDGARGVARETLDRWPTRFVQVDDTSELELQDVLAGSTREQAQALMYRAQTEAGLTDRDLALKLGKATAWQVSRLRESGCRLPIATFGRYLAICGFEVRLALQPISGPAKELVKA